MLKWKFECIRSLEKEIRRLEGLCKQMNKCRDYEKKEMYHADLQQCRLKKEELVKEDLLETLILPKREKEMAKRYYYEAKEWNLSYDLSYQDSKEFDPDDEDDHKRKVNMHKQRIRRAVYIY